MTLDQRTRWWPALSSKAASAFVAPHVPYAGEVRITITTAPGQPEVLVARTNCGKPREQFVDDIVARLHDTQPDGSKHEWTILATAQGSAT